MTLKEGEAWKKVFGPVFFYLNSDSSNNHPTLWEDAKRQVNSFKKNKKNSKVSFNFLIKCHVTATKEIII